MISITELRKKYLGAPEATDKDMEIVRAVREYHHKLKIKMEKKEYAYN